MATTVEGSGDKEAQVGPATPTWDDEPMDSVMPYVLALVPTVGVTWLFYVIIKNILEGDRRERMAQAKWESERGADTSTKASPTATGDQGSGRREMN